MFMITAILSGITLGILLKSFGKKKSSDSVRKKLDNWLLHYGFPMMLILTAMRLSLSWSQGKVTVLMAIAMTLSFGAAWLIAKHWLKLIGPKMREMLNGFLILAVCSNTGHGVMLASSATTDASILGLLMGPMYIGFLCVIFLPQFLVNRAKVGEKMRSMILWHPVSYGSIAGFASVIDYRAGYIYLCIITMRFIIKKEWASLKPLIAVFLTMVLYRLGGDIGAAICGYYPILLLFLTAITIGIKLLEEMDNSHWRIVWAITSFGLIIAPAIGLIISKLTFCSYEEAFVIVYSLSQPPAYLGMLWLKEGTFGEDFSISEKAFAIQGVIAYSWGIVMPYVLTIFF